MDRGSLFRVVAAAVVAALPASAWLAAATVETGHLVVDDVERQLSAPELERFAASAEQAFVRAAGFWSVPDRGARIVLELHRERGGRALSVFELESTATGKRSVVRVYGVRDPREMVHKLTHALFPTDDKLVRNMMGIPTEVRFGNPLSFPMCGFAPDAWVVAIRRAGAYLPLGGLGAAHEDWGMSFRDGTPVVSDRKRQHASYAEAGSFGTFLLDRFGAGKVKSFLRASREENRPWKRVFGLDIGELEAEWLRSVEAPGHTPAARVELLEGLWREDPKTACDRAEAAARR